MVGMTDLKERQVLDSILDVSGKYVGLFTTAPTDDVRTIASISGNGTTVTVVTETAHGYTTGQTVFITGCTTTTGYNGSKASITVTNSTTFTFAAATTGTAGGTPQVHRGVEVTGSGYSRVAIGATDWNAATGGAPSTKTGPKNTVNSGNGWRFTATADWGTIVAFGIWDGSGNTANLEHWGNLASSTSMNSGDIVQFDASNLVTVQLGDSTDTF